MLARLLRDLFPSCFFCNNPPTTELYTLSLHDALPISSRPDTPLYAGVLGSWNQRFESTAFAGSRVNRNAPPVQPNDPFDRGRSEVHTSELQSHSDLVCRLLLEKKKNTDKKSRRKNIHS